MKGKKQVNIFMKLKTCFCIKLVLSCGGPHSVKNESPLHIFIVFYRKEAASRKRKNEVNFLLRQHTSIHIGKYVHLHTYII